MDTLNFSEQIPEALPYSASIREIMQHIQSNNFAISTTLQVINDGLFELWIDKSGKITPIIKTDNLSLDFENSRRYNQAFVRLANASREIFPQVNTPPVYSDLY